MDKTVERIICRYLDGTATAEEIAELDRCVKGDPEARRTLLTYSIQDVQVETALKERTGESRSSPPRRHESWFHRWGWVGMAAGFMVVAIVFYALTKMSRELRPVSTLTAAAVSSSRIDLAWTPGSREDRSYTVERSTDGNSYAMVARVDNPVTTFTDTGLTPGTAYQYRITTRITSGQMISSDPVRVRTMSSAIVNTSARGLVGTGYKRMIAGFIIKGDAPKKVFIRTRGPSLAESGVPDVLANPVLEVYSVNQKKVVARNDDWQAYDPLGEQNGYPCGRLDEIKATALMPSHALESAILITLPPGTYAAFLSGVEDGTGLGMIEVFEVNE